MGRLIATIVRTTLVTLILCGLLYPAVVTAISQATMADKANGSLIYDKNNKVIGSELIGQSFTSPKYFHGRVSSIEYQSAASGSNNYAPSNPDLQARVIESIAQLKKDNPTISNNDIPVELLTNSGSGLDPHITPESAYLQVGRVANATGLSKVTLKKLVESHTEGGTFGEKRVNVLELNLDLKNLF